MINHRDGDANECQRLELELLTSEQKRFLDNERSPRWELNPPQREEYDTPRNYVLALGRYADAVRDAKLCELGEECVPTNDQH